MRKRMVALVFCTLSLSSLPTCAENIEKLINQCYFRLGYRDFTPTKACQKLVAVIPTLTDQVLLAKIALGTEVGYVQLAATRKLTDQTALLKIAQNEHDLREAREAAIANLTDQAALTIIAEGKDNYLCEEAFNKLYDQASLAEVALKGNHYVRGKAFEKLTDQAILARFALIDDYLSGMNAVMKLTDQTLLAKVAVGSPRMEVRREAAAKLSDQRVLAKVATEDKNWPVREAASSRLNDQEVLAQIAINDEEPGVRKAAITNLSDQATLTKIVSTDKDAEVREAAVSKLTDQTLLTKLTASYGDPVIRANAFAAMDESNPALKSAAGSLARPARNTLEAIARIRLAIQYARIRDRFPGIIFTVQFGRVRYQNSSEVELGVLVSFELKQTGRILAKKSWATIFPAGTTEPDVLATDVNSSELLAELLHNPIFTKDDLTELSSSEIPELRRPAFTALSDR